MDNPYFGLVLSIITLYYLKLKSKGNEEWRKPVFIILITGIVTSIEVILREYFVEYRIILGNILMITLIIGFLAFFYLIIPIAWRERKNPEKKVLVYTGFIMLALTILGTIVVIILAQLGVYG